MFPMTNRVTGDAYVRKMRDVKFSILCNLLGCQKFNDASAKMILLKAKLTRCVANIYSPGQERLLFGS